MSRPRLRVERLPVGDLSVDPANLRRHPERNLDDLRASLRRFGQPRPILVDRRGVVVAGNATLLAARAEDWPTIDVVRTDLEGTEAIAYAIADNRIAELSEWDEPALVRILPTFDALEGIGFTNDELDNLRRRLAALGDIPTDPDAEWVGMPEFSQDDREALLTVTIHFAGIADRDAFFALIARPQKRSMWWPQDDGHAGSTRSYEYVAEERT